MITPPPYDLEQLLEEFAVAGVPVQTISYFEGELKTVTPEGEWIPLPESAAPVVAAHVPIDRQAVAAAKRNQVLAIAQTTVGVQLTLLTAVQQRAILACLLYKAGGVSTDMKVLPLNQWVT